MNCSCGRPVYVKKAGLCKRCYTHKYQYDACPKCGSDKAKVASLCKPCSIEAAKLPEEVRKSMKTIRNKRKYQVIKADPDKYAHRLELMRGYAKNDRVKRRVWEQDRRARMFDATTHKMPSSMWKLVLDFYGAACLKCGATENLHLDHVVPLSKGGAHAGHNFQVLCASCNTSKKVDTADYRNGRIFDAIIVEVTV